jgi:hypothetical protein
MDFSTAVVYDYDIVGIVRFAYTTMRFKIWDKFINFLVKTQLTLRISGYDPHFSMPSVATISLNVNLPPLYATVTLVPVRGNALLTNFLISVDGAVDLDTPLTFKYSLYPSKDHLEKDLITGTD